VDYLLEVASTALSIALVSLGLLLLQRSHGIALLEIISLACCLALLLLSSFRPDSVSTLKAATLLVPTLACIIFLAIVQPFYAKWRLKVAGESTSLLISFALMNCLLLAASSATNDRFASLSFADLPSIRTPLRLESLVCILATLGLAGAILYLRNMRLLAALQLSKDDYRLLATFGRDSESVRRHTVVIALLASSLGMCLYISLQETFAVSNCYAVLIPGFGIAIAQSRIRVGRLVLSALMLVAAERFFTQHTSELLLNVHRAALFSFFVLTGVTLRAAQRTGLTATACKHFLFRTRR
jgi:hypothetical protein